MLTLSQRSLFAIGRSIFLSGALVAPGAFAANAQDAVTANVLESTPLILKDGRIAEVAVHKLTFEPGSATLSASSRNELVALIAPVATDCFLTAQAIGHIKPGDGGDGNTVEAHRLARARADFVQDELTSLGIAPDSIASVWDWQFVVEEPRVTLWIFSMKQGEDCSGEPLEPNTALVADATEPQPEQPAAAAGSPESALAAEPAVDRAMAGEQEESPAVAAEAVAETAEPQPQTDAPAAPAAGEQPEQTGLTVAEAAEPAVADEDPAVAKAADDADTAVASVAPEPEATAEATRAPVEEDAGPAATEVAAVTTPATAAASGTRSAANPANDLSITFDVNSSWLPGGAVGELHDLLDGLPEGGSYKVDVTGAVGIGDVKDATPEAAEKYNRWMAERRVARVAEWLQSNASGRSLDMAENYADQDPSRQVYISVKRLR